jgi:hypothetical protein
MKFLKTSKGRQTIAIGITLIAMWPGQWILFSVQWPFYEALRTTAGIIFAVIGAWVTVLYPRGLERVFNRKMADSGVEVKRVNSLMAPLFYSTIVLAIVLLIGPLSEVVKLLLSGNIPYRLARALSFGLLVYLTLVQMWSLILTLLPAEVAQEELGQAQYKKDLSERYQSLGRRQG